MIYSKPPFSQRGIALPITLIIMVCITMIALAFAVLFTKRLELNTLYVHRYTAQYVAESGLNKYLWALNNEPYNASAFIAQSPYIGYDQNADGYYYITASNQSSSIVAPSLISITCTGWLAGDPGNQFSFTAQLQARQFCQYLYFTQHETEDDGTTNVFWGPSDVLHGGLFTNDIIYTKDNQPGGAGTTIYTPIFWGMVKYAGNSALQTSKITHSNNPTAMQQEFPAMSSYEYFPQHSDPMNPPPNNSILIAFAKAPPTQGPLNGSQSNYYFIGRTCIYLAGNQFYYDNQGGGRMGPYPLPENGVIYVDGDFEDSNNYPISNDINQSSHYYKNEDVRKYNLNLGNVFISGTLQGQLTIGARNNIYLTAGDPTSPYTGSPSQNFITYQTNTFTKGTGSINANLYTNTNSTDMLGLVANNYVMILRWGWPSDSSSGVLYTDIGADHSHQPQPSSDPNYRDNHEIDAAIMALNWTFCVEDADWEYNHYPPGQTSNYLYIVGAIMQIYRGIISSKDLPGYDGGTSIGSGYLKNYWFDPRMSYETPPHYIEPTNSGWGILNWSIAPPPTPAITLSPATDITLPQDNITVLPGSSLQLTAIVNPQGSAPQTVTWSLSDIDKTGTTIDPSGFLVAGIKTGTVKVKATSNVYPSISYMATINIQSTP